MAVNAQFCVMVTLPVEKKRLYLTDGRLGRLHRHSEHCTENQNISTPARNQTVIHCLHTLGQGTILSYPVHRYA